MDLKDPTENCPLSIGFANRIIDLSLLVQFPESDVDAPVLVQVMSEGQLRNICNMNGDIAVYGGDYRNTCSNGYTTSMLNGSAPIAWHLAAQTNVANVGVSQTYCQAGMDSMIENYVKSPEIWHGCLN